ncbi:hypothetical protein M3181_05850 [Mesobacillus maritimus]|uniref:hypothetical protein n=1 Tax=Mesobacillus maritimus TaxID=1643336 RepID=UPI00204021A4|nr:hypothetical protein [Mesobacillus maritimus]MCM3668524.1 hypothetical protein [Mesobacillus maritimus]
MGINFHDGKNRHTYTTRIANDSWMEAVKKIVSIEKVTNAADIGCGGGIYVKARL